MKCEYAQMFLNELADGQLTDEQSQYIEKHIAQCAQCKEQLAQIVTIKNKLSQIHFNDEISDEFIDKAIHQAERINNPVKQATSYFSKSYFAIAASFFIILSISFLLFKPAQQPVISNNALSEQHLNLLFNAPKALDNVTFTVNLPDQVEMLGFPGLKQVSWQGQIKKGKNLLSIPIVSRQVKAGIITTVLQHENTKRTFKINYQKNKPSKQVT